MIVFTTNAPVPDERIVEAARRLLAQKRKTRWLALVYGVLFLGLSAHFFCLVVDKMQGSDADWEAAGFGSGLAIAMGCFFFALPGALCLGKFVSGFTNDFRLQELLVKYHDRLRDLGELPAEKKP